MTMSQLSQFLVVASTNISLVYITKTFLAVMLPVRMSSCQVQTFPKGTTSEKEFCFHLHCKW